MVLLPEAIAANEKFVIIMAAVAACIALTVAVVVAFTSITAPSLPSEEVAVRYDRFGGQGNLSYKGGWAGMVPQPR